MNNLSNENIIHIKENGIEYLQFKRLLEYKDKIAHCFAIKGKNNNDYKENNGENYYSLYKKIKLDYEGFTKIDYQAHTDIVEIVNDNKEKFNNIDGLITNKNGISLSIRTADCTPILIYDPIKNVIGNIHSGWRGTVQKIVQKGIQKMIEKYDCNPAELIVCIGPAICKNHFEVDEDVKQIFEKTFSYISDTNEFIKNGQNNKYYIDTNYINKKLLQEIGIKQENIIESKICTVCNHENIHSYRVDKEKSGRNTAIIGLI